MLLVNGMTKDSELDSYEDGMTGEWDSHYIDYRFKSDTIEGLIKQLIYFTGHKDVCLNACEEVGRIDIQGLENKEGMPATPSEKEAWKAGNVKLWAATYIVYVCECLPYTIRDGHETYITGEMK